MKTTDFDYELPRSAIAQCPVYPRHSSRLLVLDRTGNVLTHSTFWDIDQFLRPNDLLVINRTRVIPARLHALKPTGGQVEILLLKQLDETRWEVLIGGKRIKAGMRLDVLHGPSATVQPEETEARRQVVFDAPVGPYLAAAGEMPLPPYIHERLADQERYQTVYAQQPGSAAAPTAGLHFTHELMDKLARLGIHFADVTLHVGLDTFAPVNEDDPRQHTIHSEWCELPAQTAEMITKTKAGGGRVIAVGTTSVRTLESAAQAAGSAGGVVPFSGDTRLFITPGHTYKVVDAMITNFHLPKSTLLMLVSAFAGRETILNAYHAALSEGYRFFSFGDAMFIM